ncbi:M10 family metallopeptidase C-terminal domain-containing protein [Sphingomonas glaciei]|uniref:M10 family metallopeptidase C-terminal domain-containing protein n=1 Tax=Sphingomonas glaciei TaxID=2938948 RepID=A0ABY5MS25_9SPHN|nr:M10 family metallopeptidase C-terminal domain-containing protein [Sphingomonas glaciei]UUR06938.1 M10 family metallopeptidase C-terminal domain-containing protein [Sphingomonas glaciei]
MASPYVEFDENGQIVGGLYGKYVDLSHLEDGDGSPSSEVASHANGGTITGTLDNEDAGDRIQVDLVAGQTYSWAYRPAGSNGIRDPYLRLLAADGTTVLAEDDDGGLGASSQITYTATVSGTYYLNATSWYQADPTAPDYQDNGSYSIAQWSPQAGHDAGSTIATSGRSITVGTNYEYLEQANDVDFYSIQLNANTLYSFTYNGGLFAGDARGPGESVGVLALYNAAGATQVGLSVNSSGETTISFFVAQAGTYYLRAEPLTNFANDPGPEATGGYTIDVVAKSLAELNPLDAIDWKSSDIIDTTVINGVRTAKVYFAAAGETFGERTGANPITSYGWNDTEKAAVMDALKEFTKILGITYEITTVSAEAEFRLITTAGAGVTYGAYMYPQDPAYGTQEGVSAYNVNSGGWDKAGVSTQDLPGNQVSLTKGGYSYAVILHEMGHGHGLAHPHDRGGGSEILAGVSSATGTLGVFDLNQGVYTVMSYNDAWQKHPDGPSPFTISGISNGWSGTLSAFDIAMLQKKYNVRPDYATGDTTYTLDDTQGVGTYYETIYDTGGIDTIAYTGAKNATIDLLAATLDYSPTGGGVLSFVRTIKGGFTIANGVVIENATGGSGNDMLLGNAVGNVLTGNAGNDTLLGRAGNDLLVGGAGDDVLDGEEGVDTAVFSGATQGIIANLLAGTATGEGNDTLRNIENVIGSGFADRIIGDANANRIAGGNGLDVVTLGGGNDSFVAEVGTTKVALKTGTMSVDIITDFDALGDDVIDLGGLSTFFSFKGTAANKNAGDITYKTYTSVNGAENALGFDIDGNPGASDIAGPVTVVYGNTNGGPADFAIILLNTAKVDADDFDFGSQYSSRVDSAGADVQLLGSSWLATTYLA